MKRMTVLILVSLALLLAVSSASGQTGGPYNLSWNALSNGGVTYSTGGSFTLGGTVAEPAAAAPMTGGTFILTGGFWVGAPPLNAYVPLVRK
jgi:hypothetical protein